MLVGNAHVFLVRRYCCVYCIDSKSGDTTVCTSMQTPCIKFYAVFYIVSHHMLSTAAVVNKRKNKEKKIGVTLITNCGFLQKHGCHYRFSSNFLAPWV